MKIQKWLYRRVSARFELDTDTLNTHGADGWELVAITMRNDEDVQAYFKRPAGGTNPQPSSIN
jgi:hypothetical protein